MDFLTPAQGDPDSEIEEKGLLGYNFLKAAPGYFNGGYKGLLPGFVGLKKTIPPEAENSAGTQRSRP
jgi:hypothetical protein